MRSGFDQAASAAVLRLRYVMKPTPAKPRIIMAQVEGSGTADVTPCASVKLSTVGQRKVLAGCTDSIVSDVMAPSETNPTKLDVRAPIIVWEVTPLLSVRLKTISPGAKSPEISLPKKFPPTPRIMDAKPEKVIESVAVFVDSHGLATLPAPKKVVVSAAAE